MMMVAGDEYESAVHKLAKLTTSRFGAQRAK
jgi:hypothetical protein